MSGMSNKAVKLWNSQIARIDKLEADMEFCWRTHGKSICKACEKRLAEQVEIKLAMVSKDS